MVKCRDLNLDQIKKLCLNRNPQTEALKYAKTREDLIEWCCDDALPDFNVLDWLACDDLNVPQLRQHLREKGMTKVTRMNRDKLLHYCEHWDEIQAQARTKAKEDEFVRVLKQVVIDLGQIDPHYGRLPHYVVPIQFVRDRAMKLLGYNVTHDWEQMFRSLTNKRYEVVRTAIGLPLRDGRGLDYMPGRRLFTIVFTDLDGYRWSILK